MLGDVYIDPLGLGDIPQINVCVSVSEDITSVKSNLRENFKLGLRDKMELVSCLVYFQHKFGEMV